MEFPVSEQGTQFTALRVLARCNRKFTRREGRTARIDSVEKEQSRLLFWSNGAKLGAFVSYYQFQGLGNLQVNVVR